MPLAVAVPTATAGITQLIWVHANHMGVPIRYSDASGNMVNPTGDYSVPGFPGQSQTTTDLYYNKYRDYDPTTGRYIQADPIGLAGGASPYSYAMNNPLLSALSTNWQTVNFGGYSDKRIYHIARYIG
jgi:RHS repeat-associated protein